MRRATPMVCLAVALGLAAGGRGHAQAPDPTGVAGALAAREAATYVAAFNDHKSRDLEALFTEDAEFAFLQGPSIEKVQYGLISGRPKIISSHETFFSMYPGARLKQTVVHARMVRPDVLVADTQFELTGLPSNAGPIRGRAVTIRVLESGVWKIATERNVSRTPDPH